MSGQEETPQEKATFRFSPNPSRAGQIGWYEWGKEAFDLSREHNKPVLLSISAVWCHWCHVMDETNFSDEEIITFINHNFIPVRVDSDRRPDINSRYNQGGWPTLCFLTGEGEIIAGTTYVPPEQLRRLLVDVVTVFAGNPDRIKQAVDVVREQRAVEARLKKGSIDLSIVEGIAGLAADAYDQEHGGFGSEPKFPYTSVLMLLMARLASEAEGNEGEMVRETLEAMSAGGMYDHVSGGFFRYATAKNWSKPHYEKMLEDNAELLTVFTEASRLSGDEGYENTARDIYRYLFEVLRDPDNGAFAGSQDASQDYYQLEAGDRKAAAAPYVDRTVYSGWNASAAAALLKAFQVFGDEDFRNQALQVMGFVWDRMWSEDAGLAHYHDGEPRQPGMLADTARLAGACLDAYESGAGDKWLDRAITIGRWMRTNLEDGEQAGFFDCALAPGDLGYPSERNKPPVDNSVTAALFIRLAQNTGQQEFSESARMTLELFSGSFEHYGLFGADYALAVMRFLDPPVRVTILGPLDESATTDMIRAAHNARIPFRSVEVLDPAIHGEELEAAGYGYEGKTVAYICVGASCQPPVDDAIQLPMILESSWAAIRGQ